MAKVLVSESNLTNIANAIRAKNGSSDTYTPAQMATAIQGIQTGMQTYTCTYPTSTANQSLQINLLSSGTVSNGLVQFNGCGVELKLVPDSGYEAGSIVIDGVDTGSDTRTINPLTRDTVISVTNATEHQYLFNTTADVVYSSAQGSWNPERIFLNPVDHYYSCMAYNSQTGSSEQVTCDFRQITLEGGSSQTLIVDVRIVDASTNFHCNTKIILNDEFSFDVNILSSQTWAAMVSIPTGLLNYLRPKAGQTISLKFDYA